MKKLHICLVGDNSIHFQRWIKSLSENDNYKISAVSLSNVTEISNVNYYYLKSFTNSKLDYILNINKLKDIIRRINPDVVHCHYASGYGLMGAMSGFHPFILSVWGDDVISFPNNFITRKIITHTLKKADRILATSHYLKAVTEKYTDKEVDVINFGIDTNYFMPKKVSKDEIYIGTVKSLHYQYGIDVLISAFHILTKNDKYKKLKLLIVGGGTLEEKLKKQVEDLGINAKVIFRGRVAHSEVPHFLNLLDIFVAVSVSESFGVAVLEAQSCEKPVIVSNVGGLPEVVIDNFTGIIVPPRDPVSTANAMDKLLSNPEEMRKMGISGREFVLKKFKWETNVEQMCSVYNKYMN